MKGKATVRYDYRRALLPLCICTAVFAIFTWLTARDNIIQSATAFGFNGRFFWCAYMFFAYKGFENLFDQQSVSQKTRFRALVGFLPFSGLVAAANLLLCYGGILLYNHYCQTQILQNSSAVLWKYFMISDAEIPRHLFFGLTGISGNGSAAFLIVLGLLLCALSVIRGMLFGVLLARLFHKLPRRIAFLLALGGTAIFAGVCVLINLQSTATDTYFCGLAVGSFLFGNGGANATLSVLFADVYMLCLYLILLRLTDGTVFRRKSTFRKQITRAAIGCALILVLGVCNVLLCTPTLVNALERTKTLRTDHKGNPVAEYTYAPDERAFRLLRLQTKFALPAYRISCLSALAQNYYIDGTLEYLSYADGAAVFDELLQTFDNSANKLTVDFPLLYPAADTFAAVENANTPYEEKSEILANACLYFSKHGDIERAKRAYEAVVQPDFLIGRHDIFMCAATLNCITLYIDNEQDRLWAAEQFDALADITEKAQYEYSDSDNARFRQSAAELRGEEISDSEAEFGGVDL
ncbi:MAG: hypothetical protein ACI4LB_02605 [Candidatus Fimenecus sp.]